MKCFWVVTNEEKRLQPDNIPESGKRNRKLINNFECDMFYIHDKHLTYPTKLTLTLTTRGHWFYFSQVISGITKPTLGMLVLIWMHFSWWFQIWLWNFTISKKITILFNFLPSRLHSLAAWKALRQLVMTLTSKNLFRNLKYDTPKTNYRYVSNQN